MILICCVFFWSNIGFSDENYQSLGLVTTQLTFLGVLTKIHVHNFDFIIRSCLDNLLIINIYKKILMNIKKSSDIILKYMGEQYNMCVSKKIMLWKVLFSLIIFLMSSCTPESDEEQSQFSGQITEASYSKESDEIMLKLSFSACDTNHEFAIKMGDVCQESYPAQCDAHLLHVIGADQSCDMAITKDVQLKVENHPYDKYFLNISGTIVLIDRTEATESEFKGQITEGSYSKESDEIVLQLTFSGCGTEHEFALEMGDACLESYPAQCGAKLLHLSRADQACEMAITKELRLKVEDHPYDKYYLNISGTNVLVDRTEAKETEFKGQILGGSYSKDTDEIVLQLSFSGCNTDHEFALEMGDACLESYPAQCGAKLLHVSGADQLCKMAINKEVRLKVENHSYEKYYLNISGTNVLIDRTEAKESDFKGQIIDGTYNKETDEIVLQLSFSGCNAKHGFALEMGGICLESYPAQCGAKLLHVSGADQRCEMLITKDVSLKVENHLYDKYYLNINGTKVLIDRTE